MERDTTGIFLWSHPFVIQDGRKKIAVLLMDTQGTFDDDSTINECATIFALSTLVSSVQIYNLMTQIQEDDLQNLRLFSEFGKVARISNKDEKPFQKLLFLIRDWRNPTERAFGYSGGEKYAREKLEIRENHRTELRDLRNGIQASFETITGFLMPYPGDCVAEGQYQDISPRFLEKIREFVPGFFRNAVLKKIDGKEITSLDLLEQFKALMAVFRNGTMPQAQNIFDATVEGNNNAAYMKAMAVFLEQFQKKVQENPDFMDVQELYSIYAKKAAYYVFDNAPRLGGEEQSRPVRTRLVEEMQAHLRKQHTIILERKKAFDAQKEAEAKEKQLQEEQERHKKEKEELERKRRQAEEDAEWQRRQRREDRRRHEMELEQEKRRAAEAAKAAAEAEAERLRKLPEEQQDASGPQQQQQQPHQGGNGGIVLHVEVPPEIIRVLLPPTNPFPHLP